MSEFWFNTNRDCLAGLNRSQAEAIGESYPLKKGWRKRVIGKKITISQKESFETAKGLVYKVKKELVKNKRNTKIFSSQKETLTLEVEVAKLRLELKEIKEKIKLYICCAKTTTKLLTNLKSTSIVFTSNQTTINHAVHQ